MIVDPTKPRHHRLYGYTAKFARFVHGIAGLDGLAEYRSRESPLRNWLVGLIVSASPNAVAMLVFEEPEDGGASAMMSFLLDSGMARKIAADLISAADEADRPAACVEVEGQLA